MRSTILIVGILMTTGCISPSNHNVTQANANSNSANNLTNGWVPMNAANNAATPKPTSNKTPGIPPVNKIDLPAIRNSNSNTVSNRSNK